MPRCHQPVPPPPRTPSRTAPVPPRTCRYRKWRLNDDDNVDILVRCELDGVINSKGEDQLLSIKALNEYDMKTQVRLAVGRLGGC